MHAMRDRERERKRERERESIHTTAGKGVIANKQTK